MKQNILVVSEALGEPNHKRGIFHFTRELMRSIAAEGHELTLLVETGRRYRKLRRRERRTKLFPTEARNIELLALYRFLDEINMAEPPARNGLRRTLDWLRHKVTMSVSSDYVACFLRAICMRGLHARLIENKTAALEYIPPDLRHLELFHDFQLEPGFYTYQDSSALLMLPPPRIDARDYDVIVVDTPTRVAIRRRPDAKVICVVHDLLPLTDLKLSDVATRLFLSRLLTSLKQADELAFVSKHSMMRFRELLPQFAHLPARVVYPRTRFDAPDVLHLPAPSGRSGRPNFVIIVSNEPRKNVAAVVRAFRNIPQADLVVIGYAGQINRMRDIPKNVRFAGYVDEQEKAALIAEAHGLIMPSLAEGFGIPIIEALAANTPVLCSDIAVFREVAGELANYFDPFAPDSIVASVTQVLARQEEYRGKIRARRSELSERFGYQTQARDFLGRIAPPERLVAAQ
ncbi:glycosyltransferase family 4 protein [Bradyrhizobium sp. INPA01-394B]|uniref:Glycosyltransferase family 4 protein n=1 Tax=Bradyrhizobium campsiandrae TaxID=1729892 RepID=A0ABR7U821_9BRAD|nr:glycosyltransferase family 1 protein [Bradyrhizobium campsiandrae]MBC9876017.1 glycosyltransferase family 4 protein [Bradyrhizobium campsiandrae]MBC9979559.1 glycosyltransferase family 4 protein [Bradyrhizobium campsiandrae]